MDELDALIEAELQARKKPVDPVDALIAEETARRGGVSTNSKAVDELGSKARSLAEGVKKGMTYGYAPEGAGALGAAIGATFDPEGRGATFGEGTFRSRYENNRDVIRGQEDTAREANPVTFSGGQVLGVAPQAIAVAPFATGGSLLTTAGRSGAIGAVEGALHGSGNSPGNRIEGGSRGAVIGAGLGAAAPLAVAGGAATVRAVSDPVTGFFDALRNTANTSKANRALDKLLNQSGKNVDEIAEAVAQAARQGQPEYRMVDALGVTGQRGASGIARGGGDAGTEISDFLAKRQAGQSERVGGFVDEAFGLDGKTAAARLDALKRARKFEADKAYSAAAGNAAPVDVSGAVGMLDETIGKMTNSGIKPPKVVSEYRKLRAKLAGKTDMGEPTTLSDYDSVLALWREVRDNVDKAYDRGDGALGEALKPVRDALEASLSESSLGFRTANQQYREASRVIDAIDIGKSATSIGRRSADTTAEFAKMTPEQQAAARAGYGDSLLGKIEGNASPTSNAAKVVSGSQKRDAEAAAMALDPETYAARLSRENEMWATQNRALGGSRTADNLSDVAAGNEMAAGALDVGRSVMNLQVGDAIAKTAARLAPLVKGQNDATRTLIARALMSKDPAKALEPVLREAMKTQGNRRFVEALLRNSGIPAFQQVATQGNK